MTGYWIGMVIGSIIFGYLWSRLWLWIVKRFVKVEPRRLFIAYGIAWVTAVLAGAFGFASDGAPNWNRTLLTYTPVLTLWLGVDLLARKGRARSA